MKITEKAFLAVPVQSLTSDGSASGELLVADACQYHVGQIIILNSDAEDAIKVKINRINSDTSLEVGPAKGRIHERFDASDYLTADNASIIAQQQPRPSISPDDVIRAVFAEEPRIALRSLLVDKLGNQITESNPLPITGTISTTPIQLDTENVVRTPVATKDTEVEIALPNGTIAFILKARNNSTMRVSMTSGETDFADTGYWTVFPGKCLEWDGLQLNSRSLFVQTTKDNEIVELWSWTE